MKLDKTTVRLMLAIVGLLVLTCGTVGLLNLNAIRNQGEEQVEVLQKEVERIVREKIKTQIETLVSHFEWLEQKVRNGAMTEEEAQELAVEQLGSYRYDDGTGYFWIHSFDKSNPDKSIMLAHPKAALVGTDVSEMAYSSGPKKGEIILATRATHRGRLEIVEDEIPMFVQMNRVIAAEGGAGFVGYEWPKPGTHEFQRKLSFVRAFPAWGWVLGTGVYLDDVEKAVTAQSERARATVASSVWTSVGAGAGVLALGLVGALFVGNWLRRRIQRIIGTIQIAAGEGDLTVRLEADRSDSLGELAHWFNVFLDQFQQAMNEIKQGAADIVSSVTSLTQTADSMTSKSDAMGANMASIAAAVEEINLSINAVAAASEQASTEMEAIATASSQSAQNVTVVASGAEEVSSNVNNVSAAIEEMSVSLGEVAQNCVQTAQASRSSTDKANAAMTKIFELAEASKRIGKVLELIENIANQTNLLALNATIEAASAGDAGKGFNVVANEVKALAKQTAGATDEIAEQVRAMQADMKSSVTMMEEVTKLSEQVSELADMIAAAVEEQTATTNEIARNIAGGAEGALDISRAVQELNAGVEESARHTNEAAAGIIEIARTTSGVAGGVTEISENMQQTNTSVEEMIGSATTVNVSTEALKTAADRLHGLIGRYRI